MRGRPLPLEEDQGEGEVRVGHRRRLALAQRRQSEKENKLPLFAFSPFRAFVILYSPNRAFLHRQLLDAKWR